MRPTLALALCVSASAIFAQAPAEKLEFEVASVRPSTPPDAQDQNRVSIGLHLDGSQVRIVQFTLRDYVAMAYRVKAYQVSAPDSFGGNRFDLSAKLPAGAKSDQIPEMLQALLAERFQLKFHRDKKDLPVYALLLGKPPLKLKEVPETAPAGDAAPPVNVSGTGSAAGVSVDLGGGSSYTFANNKFEGKKLTMDRLAQMLERYVDRPIINMTDLKGAYNVSLPVTEEDYRAMLIRAAINTGLVLPPQVLRLADGNSAASLMDAAQQVGLKLDARKAPIEMIVVDQALKAPTEN